MPDPDWLGGLVEAQSRVRVDHDLHAVVIETEGDCPAEMILAPEAAIDLLLRVISAVDQLNQVEGDDWVARTLRRLQSEGPCG